MIYSSSIPAVYRVYPVFSAVAATRNRQNTQKNNIRIPWRGLLLLYYCCSWFNIMEREKKCSVHSREVLIRTGTMRDDHDHCLDPIQVGTSRRQDIHFESNENYFPDHREKNWKVNKSSEKENVCWLYARPRPSTCVLFNVHSLIGNNSNAFKQENTSRTSSRHTSMGSTFRPFLTKPI